MPGTHRGVKVARLGYPTKVYYTVWARENLKLEVVIYSYLNNAM